MGLKINGVEIPDSAVRYELDRLVKFYSEYMSAEQVHEQLPLLRRKACEQAIGARLLIDEANRRQVPVSEADVQQRLEQMMQQAGGRQAFQKLLKRQDLTAAQVKASVEQGRRVDLLVESITTGSPEPTEEQIQAHYDVHRREYRKPDRVQARHILIKPDSEGEKDREVARSRLQEIRNRIEEGADFGDEAAAHSHCPSGTKAGGSLGWVTRGMMVPEFEAALFSMEVGTLSELIETPLGFHIINKTAGEKGEEAPLADVRENVRDFLRHAARGEAIKAFVETLRKQAVIDYE